MICHYCFYRGSAQQPVAIILPAIEIHLQKSGVILCSARKTSAAGKECFCSFYRVICIIKSVWKFFPLVVFFVLNRNQTVCFFLWKVKSRVIHPQRVKNTGF